MRLTDLLLLRWIFGRNQNRERVTTSDGTYICGGCREPVTASAHICSSCSSALYTIRGRIGRPFGAMLGLFFLIGSSGLRGVGASFFALIGVMWLVLAVYWYLTRPVHSLFSVTAITDRL
jgi:hypothetical protein